MGWQSGKETTLVILIPRPCGRREVLRCVSANENVVQCKNLPEELVFSALGLHCQVAEKVRNVCYLIAV